MASKTATLHTPKLDIEKYHKVIRFGARYTGALPEPPSVSSQSGREYRLIQDIKVGDSAFTDASCVFTDLGSFTPENGFLYIQVPNGDKGEHQDAKQLEISLASPVSVYIMFYDKAPSTHNLKRRWVAEEGWVVETSLSSPSWHRSRSGPSVIAEVRRKDFDRPGSTVCLQGNGEEKGGNYLIFLRPDLSIEEEKYTFLHQRFDLKVTRGIIPVGFLSSVNMPETHPLFLETRAGGYERNQPLGPEYRVSWKKERETIPPNAPWKNDLDALWTSVLSYFESKHILGEDSLNYLDADPFVLFGIDDPITQQALKKLEDYPALLSEDAEPNFDEWASYLRIDPNDRRLSWLVSAFAETELPKPWTCYKGVGSIICFIRPDTGAVMWKHPFYDYFRQLRDFCLKASPTEIMQVRMSRLLWSYEATRVETEPDQDPLVSPDYIRRMADIFGYDVRSQGYLVRNLKAQLKVFARTYRENQEILMPDVDTTKEILELDCAKYSEMCDLWGDKIGDETEFKLKELTDGQVNCVNCRTTAMAYCLECKDYLCLKCYAELHSKGARLQHSPFRLVPCALCVYKPAKLHCTFTDKSLCHYCYAMEHIKMLPPDGKENHPNRIDYEGQYRRYADFAYERTRSAMPALLDTDAGATQPADYESVLSTDWHPFYDVRGVKYYHNFATGERMRQSPRRVPNTEDRGAEPARTLARSGTTALGRSRPQTTASRAVRMVIQEAPEGMVPLTGFDSLESDTRAEIAAANQPVLRDLRPPHRVHMPHQVPAG